MAGGALHKFMVDFGLKDDGLAEVETVVNEPQFVTQGSSALAPKVAPQVVREPYIEENRIGVVTPIQKAPGYQPQPQPEMRRITTIHPRSYNDARLIGEAFRAGTPVIINLSDMSDEDAKRLVDFSSGLIFGLHGGIERVTNKVFLLSPEHIEVVGEEEIEASGTSGSQFYNQS